MRSILFFVVAVALLSSVFAVSPLKSLRHARANPISVPVAHTWHNITTRTGQWSITLSVLNEHLSFIDINGNNITSLTVDPKNKGVWGTVIYDDDDFNCLYAMTAIQQSNTSTPAIALKTCVFIIGAYGPADPQIQAVSFNGGAVCKWQTSGIGENYFLD